MSSIRSFCSVVPLLLMVFSTPENLISAATHGSQTRPHPRLLFSSSDIPRFQNEQKTSHASIWTSLENRLKGIKPPLRTVTVSHDIRLYGEALITMAFLQFIDPQKPYETLIWDYFYTMLRYPNWDNEQNNPFQDHDLTVGLFLYSLSFTYDLYHERFTPLQRKEIIDRVTRYVNAWMHSYRMRTFPSDDYKFNNEITGNHYWINNLGVAAASIAFEGEIDTSLQRQWLDRTEKNLSLILKKLPADGSTQEGLSYGSYGQIHLFQWLDMRDRYFHESSAENIPWFRNAVYFDIYGIIPGEKRNYGSVLPFGDTPGYHYWSVRTINAWLSQRLKNPFAQWMAVHLDWPDIAVSALWWYNPLQKQLSPSLLPLWHFFDTRGIFVWRSTWNTDATYIAMKSGSYYGGHEHPDAGSFVLYREGIPFFTDPGYSFKKMSSEHNTLIVDKTGQFGEQSWWMNPVDPRNWATFTSVFATNEFFDVVMNPTPMYKSKKLKHWEREILSLSKDVFIIRDSIITEKNTPADLLFHSFMSQAAQRNGTTFTYLHLRGKNPFTVTSSTSWEITPRSGYKPLTITDVSSSSWTTVIEPSQFVSGKDLKGYSPQESDYARNRSFSPAAMGYQLKRSIKNEQSTSTLVLSFDKEMKAHKKLGNNCTGVTLDVKQHRVGIIGFGNPHSTSSIDNLTFRASIAGVFTTNSTNFFGRDMTSLTFNDTALYSSDKPTTLYASNLLAYTREKETTIQLHLATPTTITLFCTSNPGQALLDSTVIELNTTGNRFSLHLSTGMHTLMLSPTMPRKEN